MREEIVSRRFLIAMVALSLSACTSSSDSGQHSSPPTLSKSTANEVYLAVVKPLYPSTNTDAELIRFGHSVCRLFRDGAPYSRIIEALTSGAGHPKTAGKVTVAAVTAYCPAYLDSLPGGSNAG